MQYLRRGNWFRAARLWPAVLLLFCVLLLMLTVASARAAFPGANGKIVFTSNRDGNEEIYVMNADGSNQTRLTNSAGQDAHPVWSADGTKIAFTSYRDGNSEIYVMNADGSSQTRLTTNLGIDWEPAWSPDGTKIAFVSNRGSNNEVYVMNADGSNATNLTNFPTAGDGQPAWSPDGTKIAFITDRDSNYEVYVMNTNGSAQTNVSTHTGSDYWPEWSPDGTKIAFNTNRDGNYEIYAMNPDGSGKTNLTNANPANDLYPGWSPDGTKITFYTDRDGNDEIYVMNANGSGPTRLTNISSSDIHPDWQPILISPQLKIMKTVNGGPADWSFDFTGELGAFTLTDDDSDVVFSDLDAGYYNFGETPVDDYTTAIDCTNGDSSTTNGITIYFADTEDVTCTVTNTYDPPPPAAEGDLYVSGRTAGTTGDGLAFGPEDILHWDGSDWSLFFDGSSHGLMSNGKAKHNLNAIWLPDPDDDDVDDEDIVMSFGQNARHVPNITGKVDGMDLVWYDGDSQTFSLWFDGNDVDLTNKTQEKIDSLHVLPGGGPCLYNILISTQGPGRVSNTGQPAIIFSGEDVLNFCATSLGENTAGLWSMVLDGSAQGMPKNSTTSISVSDDGQTMYLTTRSTFAVDSAVGGHSMVYAYDFASQTFSGPYFIAADAGMPRHVNALHVAALP